MTGAYWASVVICAVLLGLAAWVLLIIRTELDQHAEQLAHIHARLRRPQRPTPYPRTNGRHRQ